MTPPIASVVVPSRGGAGRLPSLFEALRVQTTTDWEAIIVIDGDVDGSSAAVDRAAATLPVRRITFEENRGRSAALNAGFEGARGHVLIRCDDDLVPAPDYVERHVAGHADRDVGLVGLYRNVYPDTTYARIYGRAWDRRFREEAYRVRPDEGWRYWAGNVSVTRDSWDRVGGYDRGFRAYGWEDVDWGYRLVHSGTPIALDPGLETEHHIAATTTATRLQRAFYSGAARRRFEAKHGIAATPGQSPSVWQRAVAGLAVGVDEHRARRLGAAIDVGARLLPDRVAGKAVALAIEASARAGYRAGSTDGAI